ncbi:histone-lysine N-methyltransferase family member SUVH9-like protein [Tanacetum coccineum]|uniref:Histone-lysine N-methyltransferase family member SUVH9-like protein n=1 Tax=Tanacetum coccineum TaxID=301880 RepID=A0ABQ5BIL4_9ASTR
MNQIDNLKPISTTIRDKPKSEPINDVSHTPNPNPNPTPITTVVSHDDVADNNNVLSEYNKILELFRTTFLAKLEQQQTFDDVTDMSQDIVQVPDNQVADNNNGNGNMMTSSHRKSLQRSSELVRVTNRWSCVWWDCLEGGEAGGIDNLTSSQSSNGESIATSVIVLGGYEDGKDAGNVIVYTGHGGQDKHSRHVVHQKLEGGNLAMKRSMHYRIEVRVIRGFKYEGSASGKVYVYDGLYKIVEAWFDVGKSGFGVFKFKLVRMVNQVEMGSEVLKFANTLRARPLEARPVGYVSFDISIKKENVPVFLFNDIDNNYEPMYYEYLATTVFPQFVHHLGVKGDGCSCVSGCTLDCLCPKKNGGVFAYDANGLLVRGKPLVFKYYGMDVSRVRNLACYMSHSACPNVLVQLVLYEHSHYAFPHLMLFAMENIPPLRELSLDYGTAPPSEASSKLAIWHSSKQIPDAKLSS